MLDHTITPMGKRLIQQWVSKPLLDVGQIRQRQENVNLFFEDGMLRAELRTALKPLGDLERMTNRVVGGTAQPRDLVAMRATLMRLPPLMDLLPSGDTALNPLLSEFHPCVEELTFLETAIDDDSEMMIIPSIAGGSHGAR